MDGYAELERILATAGLWDADRLALRADALRDLAVVAELARWRRDDRLAARVADASARLEAVTAAKVEAVRSAIRGGHRDLPADDADLDVLLAALVGPEPEASQAAEEGSVHLEPTPAAIVRELVGRMPMGPGDVFVDLGAGLGQVAIQVHLATGARALAVEIEPAYVVAGRRAVADLGLADAIRFVHADARQAPLAEGTVFFLFAPFVGRMLREALDHLRVQVADRPVRVASYGPSTPVVAREPWLRALDDAGGDPFRLAVFGAG